MFNDDLSNQISAVLKEMQVCLTQGNLTEHSRLVGSLDTLVKLYLQLNNKY